MEIMSQNTKVSQLDKANAALVALAHNVTSEDRKESGFSEPTIVRYLKGEGKDLNTAMKLLKFFKERIEKRDRELSA
jgi:predicted transcriptional regulator